MSLGTAILQRRERLAQAITDLEDRYWNNEPIEAIAPTNGPTPRIALRARSFVKLGGKQTQIQSTDGFHRQVGSAVSLTRFNVRSDTRMFQTSQTIDFTEKPIHQWSMRMI